MISLYFGLPRSGKTTAAVALAAKASKRRPVYVNFDCTLPNVIVIKNDMIGKYDMSNGLIIIDEASIFADSRNHKSFSNDLVEFFCLHGHWQCDIALFTQIYNRVDSTIRMMAERVYMVKKSRLLPCLTTIYNVPYGIQFKSDEEQRSRLKRQYGDIQEGYARPSFVESITARRIFRPKWYRYFDTHSKPFELPQLPT